MGFELFERRNAPTGEPAITIRKFQGSNKVSFYVNESASRKFFINYTRTFLLYDKDKSFIGFRPTNQEENSFSLTRGKKGTGILVYGMPFLRYYEIPHEKSKRYRANWNNEEELVVIDLNKPL